MIRVAEKLVPKKGSQELRGAEGGVAPEESHPVLAKPPDGMVLIPKGLFLYGEDRIHEDI